MGTAQIVCHLMGDGLNCKERIIKMQSRDYSVKSPNYLPPELLETSLHKYNMAAQAIEEFLDGYKNKKEYNLFELAQEIFSSLCEGKINCDIEYIAKLQNGMASPFEYRNKCFITYVWVLRDCIAEYFEQRWYAKIRKFFFSQSRNSIEKRYNDYIQLTEHGKTLPPESIPFILNLAKERLLIRHEMVTEAEKLIVENPYTKTVFELAKLINPKVLESVAIKLVTGYGNETGGIFFDELRIHLDDICGFGREKEYLLNVMRYKREWKKTTIRRV